MEVFVDATRGYRPGGAFTEGRDVDIVADPEMHLHAAVRHAIPRLRLGQGRGHDADEYRRDHPRTAHGDRRRTAMENRMLARGRPRALGKDDEGLALAQHVGGALEHLGT